MRLGEGWKCYPIRLALGNQCNPHACRVVQRIGVLITRNDAWMAAHSQCLFARLYLHVTAHGVKQCVLLRPQASCRCCGAAS